MTVRDDPPDTPRCPHSIEPSFDYDGVTKTMVVGRCATSPDRGPSLARGTIMANATCSVEGCERKARSRGWCGLHYDRWRKSGDPLVFRSPDAPRRDRSTPDALCSVDGCSEPWKAKGYCANHYGVWRRKGDPLWVRPVSNPVDLILARIDISDSGCWVIRATNSNGYGMATVMGKRLYAHRVTYEAMVGPIGPGLHIDHLCRNRACVNPAHLEPVSQAENTRRGASPAAVASRTNECQRGHEFTPENTYVTPNGRRQCKECRNARERRGRR